MDKFLSDENIYLTSMRSMFFKGKTDKNKSIYA